MRRSHVALFLVLGAPVALYAAVLVPRAIPSRTDEPTSPAAYFPTAVGTKWVYQVTRRAHGRQQCSEEIESVVTVTGDRERSVTVRQLQGDSPHELTEWLVSGKELRRRSRPDQEGRFRTSAQPGPWITVLSAPLALGNSWTRENPSERELAVFTIAGWETVSVPAGVYRAVRVSVEATFFDRKSMKPIGTITGAWWYAPGIGCVKQEVVGHYAPFTIVRELASFTPGNG